MDESHRDDGASVLVGRLIRSYREEMRHNGRRLSQDGLLGLMAAPGEEYAADLELSMAPRRAC